jgi:hypothetical protein
MRRESIIITSLALSFKGITSHSGGIHFNNYTTARPGKQDVCPPDENTLFYQAVENYCEAGHSLPSVSQALCFAERLLHPLHPPRGKFQDVNKS